MTRRWLEFLDASLELATADLLSGTFAIETAYELLGLEDDTLPLRGRFRVADEIAITGLTLRHPVGPIFTPVTASANAAAASSRSTR